MKQKTHKGVSKRIKITKKKKMIKGSVVNSLLKVGNTTSKTYRKARTSEVSKGFVRKFRKLLSI